MIDTSIRPEEAAMHEHTDIVGRQRPGVWYRTRWGVALIGFAVLAALLLVYEHRIHIPFGSLFLILPLFACLGLHFLMNGGHGGHGGHGGRGGNGGRENDAPRPAADRATGGRKDSRS